MPFYFYENRRQRTVRVHDASCGHCKGGRGKQDVGGDTRTGRWHGPFETQNGTLRRARALGYEDLRWCRRCVRW